MKSQPGKIEIDYAEMHARADEEYRIIHQEIHAKALAVQERRYAMVARMEAERVARGEPRHPPYVPQPDDEAYRARAAYLIAESQKKESRA